MEEENNKVKIYMNPALIRSNFDNNLYLVSGSVWIKVPDNTKLSDYHKYMILDRKIKETEIKNWNITGSSGTEYTVSLKDNSYSCSCQGFKFSKNKTCKHIDEVNGSKIKIF